MGDLVKDLLAKFISNLPLKKLSANQTFDLASDFLMLILVIVALSADLGPSQQILKGVLIFSFVIFVAWSVKINS